MRQLLRFLGLLTGLVCGSSVGLLSAAPSWAEPGDPPVIVGPWTITPTYQSGDDVDLADAWTMSFGAGCATGSACTVQGVPGFGDPQAMTLQPSANGFTFTTHLDLDCFDQVTHELSMKHGGDYDMTATLRVAEVTEVAGASYVTALTGTMIEDDNINARGRTVDCTGPNGELDIHKRSTLSGKADALPAAPTGTSQEPAGVGPAAAHTSGTVPEFRLPLGDEAARSVAAVAGGRRSSVPGALTVPSESVRTVRDRLPQELLLVALLGLLMVFPAQIFNSTYEENHERIERTFGRLRRRRRSADGAAPPGVPGRTRRLSVFLLSAAVGTLLGGLLDPGFGADRPSAALLAGVFGALLVAVVVATASGWLFRTARHRPHEWYLRAIPSGLVVAVICVLVSRLTHFAPGYLYGLLGGAVFAAVLEKRTEGRAETVTLLVGLAFSLGAWIAFEPVAHAANGAHPGLGVLVADSFLGSLFIGGIEGLMFSLIPLRFLPGSRVRQWGWVPWLLLTALSVYVFVHVLLVPSAGYLGRSTTATATLTVALFVAFGAFSVLFWAWFRFRPSKDAVREPSDGPPDEPVFPLPPEAAPEGVVA